MAVLTPSIFIEGVEDAALRGHAERCLLRAAESLELDVVKLRTTSSNHDLPTGVEAGVLDDIIVIRRAVLEKEAGIYAASTLLEEAAHLKLARLGLIGGLDTFSGAFLHECFARWFTFHELLSIDDSYATIFDDGPIPFGVDSPRLGYVLGGFVGAAAAGVPSAQARVQRWLDERPIEAGVRRLVDHALELGKSADDAVSLASKLSGLQGAAWSVK
jgi:hypothetical protein